MTKDEFWSDLIDEAIIPEKPRKKTLSERFEEHRINLEIYRNTYSFFNNNNIAFDNTSVDYCLLPWSAANYSIGAIEEVNSIYRETLQREIHGRWDDIMGYSPGDLEDPSENNHHSHNSPHNIRNSCAEIPVRQTIDFGHF